MNILKLEIRNLRRSAIISTLSLAFFIFAMLAFFPSMKSESMQSLANAKMEGVNPSLLAAMGLSQLPDFSVISVFFGYVLQFIVLAIMFITASQGVNLLHKEEAEGTIEYLYSKPISRDEIYIEKFLAHLIIMFTMLIVLSITTVIGYLLFSDFTFLQAVKEALVFYSAILFVGLIFSSISILFSALLKTNSKTNGVVFSVVLGSFICGMISSMVEKLDFLIWLSPMDWIKGEKLLSSGILPGEWILGFTIIISCLAAAWYAYRKKDFLI